MRSLRRRDVERKARTITALPRTTAKNPISREWWEAHRRAEPGRYDWWPGEVQARLRHAIDLTVRMSGRIGPRDPGSGWPESQDYAHITWDEMLSRVQAGEKFTTMVRRRFSAAQVSAAEEAIRWPTVFLKEHEACRRALLLWMRCQASRIPFTRQAEQLYGRHLVRTVRRRLQEASEIIATRLIEGEVRVDGHTLQERINNEHAERIREREGG